MAIDKCTLLHNADIVFWVILMDQLLVTLENNRAQFTMFI